MTAKGELTQDDWNRLVLLPRWVVAGASAAQRDVAHRTTIEVEAGLIASARGRDAGNAFLAAVAADTLLIFDDPAAAGAIDFADAQAGIVTVLELAGGVNELLDAQVDGADAAAYRRWLLAITDAVVSAARSNDFLGFGGTLVTDSERHFRERLALVLGVS